MRSAVVDAVLYAASAVVAVAILFSSPLLRNRVWAQFAWPAYVVAAVGALGLAWAANRRQRAWLLRARLVLAAGVLICAVAAPLAVEVQLRGQPSAAAELHPYVSSEVVVTERAAAALIRGRDPYRTDLSSPELHGRLPSISQHFPYLPGMAAFGFPSALSPHSPWLDARVFFALVAIFAGAAAFRLWPAEPERRLRALQVLIILPTGAPIVVGAADDLPVLALMLLALVLHERGRRNASAGAIAAAALLKVTAWPLLIALAVATRARRRAMWLAPLLVATVVLAAVAAGPAAFADDVLLFPSGLTTLPSPASTSTVGSLLAGAAGQAPLDPLRIATLAMLLATALAIATAAMVKLARATEPESAHAGAAAAAAAVTLLALVVLAPVARIGYFAYPIDLAVWAALLHPPSFALLPKKRALAW